MNLTRVNTSLLIAIIVVNAYTLASPLLPELLFRVEAQPYTALHTSEAVSGMNRVTVPSMHFGGTIFEGTTIHTLQKGVWHRPKSSTPPQGGNTVLVAHRFSYQNPHGAFYHLDKVSGGDSLEILWSGKRYTYSVASVRVTANDDSTVEAPTSEPRLTLYTCTPLWLPTKRLVVTAKLEQPHE